MKYSNFVFEWRLAGKKESIISEEIPSNNSIDWLLENGTIAEEVFLACAFRNIESKRDMFAFDTRKLFYDASGDFLFALKDYVDKHLKKQKYSKSNYIAMNFDILEKVAFAYVCQMCESSRSDEKNELQNIKLALDDIMMHSLDFIREKHCNISEHIKDEHNGFELFLRLITAIGCSNIKKDYIKLHGKRKCIALYKKWRGDKLTVAFSGYYDCISTELYDFFDVEDKNRRYADYEKIADAIGAKLAGTTEFVSRYDFIDNKHKDLVRHSCIKHIIGKNKTQDNYYSCCERKIFAFLDNGVESVYGGKLFVKYLPCNECSLAIMHHVILQEKHFSMFVGLPET